LSEDQAQARAEMYGKVRPEAALQTLFGKALCSVLSSQYNGFHDAKEFSGAVWACWHIACSALQR
jgi:hypothetical protein